MPLPQALLAAGSAALVLAATPAYAAPGLTVDLSPTSADLNPGGRASLTVKLTNTGPLPAHVTVTAAAPTQLNGDVSVQSTDSACSGSGSSVGCTVDVAGNAQKSVVFTLAAKNPDSLGTGQAKTDTTGAVSVAVGGESTKLTYAVTLHGPAQASTPTTTSTRARSAEVAEVSGTVVDSTTGDPVATATVLMRDGAGGSFQAVTDSSGRYAFTSSQDRQIQSGTVTLTASRDGYQTTAAKTVDARAGQSYTGIRIPMQPSAAGTASAVPSADPSGSAGAAAAAARTAGGSGALSWVLIGAGVLLFVVGAGVAGTLVVRHFRERRQGGATEDDDRWPRPGEAGVAAVGIRAPGYDPYPPGWLGGLDHDHDR